MTEETFVNTTLKGIGVSSGVTTGRVYLLERGKVAIARHKIKEESIEREVQRFRLAIDSAVEQLNEIRAAVTDEEVRKHAFIIDAHTLILQDSLFHDEVIDTIRTEKINAEWALEIVVSRFLMHFEKVENPYLRERGQDINYIYNRLIRIMVKGKEWSITMHGMRGKSIIVAHDLSPADTIQLNLNRISGFTTDIGGRTSHTSIIARALEIPAVVGTGNITSLVKTGDTIIVDGDDGVVIINPTRETQKDYIGKQLRLKNQKKEFLRIAKLKPESRDGFQLQVGANIELLAEMDLVEKYGASGIGLYRTEYLYLSRKTLPTEEDHYHTYRKLAENKHLGYVTVRTLDIGGDKFVSHIEVPKEMNPAMGLRAIRLCLRETDLFKAQIMGILRASAYGPLKILIPMVSGIDEVRRAKAIIQECMEVLKAKKIPFNENIDIGVMIEIPSACMISDLIAKEVDFFSIGTNDLIQYTLAIDRVNEYVSYLYEPLHPAVLRLIQRTVQNAHANKIEVALCGEMAGEPLYTPILLGLELDELSMNAYAIPRVKKVIRGIDQGLCKELVNEMMAKESAREGEYLLRKLMGELFPQDFPQGDTK